MKVLVKQACQIGDVVMGPNIHKKPGTFIVPGYLVLHPYFVALVKDKKIEVIEASEEEFKDSEESLKFKDKHKIKDVDPYMVDYMENIIKGKEDEEPSDSSDDSDSTSHSEGSESDGKEEQSESTTEPEKLSESEQPSDELSSDDVKRYEELHEKAKRLNKKEKEEYEALKAKLGKE